MTSALGPWAPLTVAEARALMSGLGAPWWIAGGWAIDLYLGKTTRAHADIDVAVLRADQVAVARLLAGWDLRAAADGVLTPWREGDWLEGGARHQLWARPSRDAPWALEILLEEGGAGRWAYRRDNRVRLPLRRFGRTGPGGVPFIAPEVALLYKAPAHALARNAADFAMTVPALSLPARRWLRLALKAAHPGNPWIERLWAAETDRGLGSAKPQTGAIGAS